MIYKVFNASWTKLNKLRKSKYSYHFDSVRTKLLQRTKVMETQSFIKCGFGEFSCLSICWNRDKFKL